MTDAEFAKAVAEYFGYENIQIIEGSCYLHGDETHSNDPFGFFKDKMRLRDSTTHWHIFDPRNNINDCWPLMEREKRYGFDYVSGGVWECYIAIQHENEMADDGEAFSFDKTQLKAFCNAWEEKHLRW